MSEHVDIIIVIALALGLLYTGRVYELIIGVVVIAIMLAIGFSTWLALAAAALLYFLLSVDWDKDRTKAKRETTEREKRIIEAKHKEELEKQHLLDDGIYFIIRMRKQISESINSLLDALIIILRKILLVKHLKAIIEYWSQQFYRLFRFMVEMLKLMQFYIPSIASVIVYLFLNNSLWWIIFAIFWAICITIVGLLFRRH